MSSRAYTVRTHRPDTLRTKRRLWLVRSAAFVLSVGIAVGVGIVTAEFFLGHNDSTRESMEHAEVHELHNPFAPDDPWAPDENGVSKMGTSGFGDEN